MRTGKDLKPHELLVIADLVDGSVKWEVCEPRNFFDKSCKWNGFDLFAKNTQLDYLEELILQIPFDLSKVTLWVNLELVAEFGLSPANTTESVKIVDFLRLIGISTD